MQKSIQLEGMMMALLIKACTCLSDNYSVPIVLQSMVDDTDSIDMIEEEQSL